MLRWLAVALMLIGAGNAIFALADWDTEAMIVAALALFAGVYLWEHHD